MSKFVLFVCVENAGRSQMAEAFAKKYRMAASSAGTLPSSQINPNVAEVMKEKGFDLSTSKPKILSQEMIEHADLIVTMGCSVEKACPKPLITQMQKKLVDWELEDPKGKPIERVRMIRDEIEIRVKQLLIGP
jgi:arsenate reductase